ncbi:hypothetical protein [Croceimicrobium hydrocarbonivorans]|uniref:Lipoprotein n=1 Tax=Croceimicrobium hydrocarbonivorans TaxID=2761580 RepID=A0A7H0VEL2_9FLAO|nr:hypothetical protein [Croceimicrobium hydrocarbonivorans]QNR24160.1 hypothetical protein H4K34_17585 [Croceimicrobium hydrocarbonivorans]
MKKFFSISIALFAFTLSSCDEEDPRSGLTSAQIIQMQTENEAIPADGNSRIKITAQLQSESDPNQEITFTTDQGYFAGTEQKKIHIVKASGKSAEAYIISNREVNDYITLSAKVGDFSTSKTVSFTRALPDAFTLTAGSSRQVLNNGRGNVSLNLQFQNNGAAKNSMNTQVFLKQRPLELNGPSLSIPEFVIVDDQTASFNVSCLDSVLVGSVQVIAYLEGAEDSSRVELIVVDK